MISRIDENLANQDQALNEDNNNNYDKGLKAWLRISPEERYQHFKRNWFFHDLSYLHSIVDENGKAVDIVKDSGCGHWSNKSEEGVCVPECRYYRKYGRIEDDEMIADYKKNVIEYDNQKKQQEGKIP